MYHISRIKIIATLMFFVLFFAATPIFAAEIFFDAKNQSFAPGEEFLMQVFLNTEAESLNAVEAKLLFPANLFEAREIRDGNSSINFWIEKPHSSQSGVIVFSGITPGGLSGPRELLFSVVFRAKKDGSGAIEIRDARVLRNDGEGTPAEVRILNFEFRILKSGGQIPDSKFQIPEDTDLPETFRPEVARDESLFDGRWFVVFATQDKASGIDRYEVKESRQSILSVFRKWVSSESPYVLTDQELRSFILVKAVDKAGNERIAAVEPKYPIKWYEIWWVWGIIAVTGIVVCLIWRKFKNE